MSAIDERARHELYVAVQDTLGPTSAETLMSLLPPVGWADVATKHDLHELDGRISLRFEALEERLEARFSTVDHRFEALEERLEGRFGRIDERFNVIDERFGTYDERLEAMEHRILATLHRALAEQTRTLAFALVGSMASMASLCLGAVALLR